jgi:ATP synthase protein I
MTTPGERLEEAARKAAQRRETGRRHAPLSLGAQLGQIGVLGWLILGPALLGLLAGRWLDHAFGAGITFTAALIFAGVALGLWFAYRWMMQSR